MNRTSSKLMERLQLVLMSPGFLVGLAVLLLNDLYLKQAFGNFVTGKLSDVAGLFILPLFLAALFPRKLLLVHIGVFVIFLFWKMPIASVLIDQFNSIAHLKIGRTVDYSDYLALGVLPLSYGYFHSLTTQCSGNYVLVRAATFLVLFISLFAFTATTLTKDRLIVLEDKYLIAETHNELESLLRNAARINKLRVRRDDEVFANLPNAQVDLKTYFFDFVLDQRTCDSDKTEMSFLVEEGETHTVLRGIDIRFECHEYESASNNNGLDKSYKEHAGFIFRQEILSRLTLTK